MPDMPILRHKRLHETATPPPPKPYGTVMDETTNEIFTRDMGSLEALNAFIAGFIARHDIDSEPAYILHLAAEEIFTNLIKYDPGGDADIPVTLHAGDERIVLEIINSDGAEFDVTDTGPGSAGDPLHERKPGGVGLHLVRHMADDFRYTYRDGAGITTVTIRLEGKGA